MRLLWPLVAVVSLAIVMPGHSQNQVRKHCSITKDPHLKNFNGEGDSVPFPCLFRASNLLSKNNASSDYSYTRVDVSAASGMKAYEGRYYVESLIVSVTFLSGDLGSLSTEETATFRVDGDSIRNFNANPSAVGPLWTAESSGDISGEVEYGFDSIQQLAYLYFTGASQIITFRPVNRSDGIPQSRMPGVDISIVEDFTQGNGTWFPSTLCSSPKDDRNLDDLANVTSLPTHRLLMLYTVLGQESPQTDSVCQEAINVFKNCGEVQRIASVQMCDRYLMRNAVNCTEAKGAGSAFQAFVYCLHKWCENDAVAAANLTDLTSSCNI